MKKILLFLIVSSFLLSGCSSLEYKFDAPKELISKPKSTKHMENLKKVAMQFMSAEDKFTISLNSKDFKSVNSIDVDLDGEDELLVLYKKGGVEGKYGIFMLKKQNERYSYVGNVEVDAQAIDYIGLEDITGDKKPEILIGWQNEDANIKKLTVISYRQNMLVSIGETNYTEFAVEDFDDDGVKEIFALERVSYNESNIVKLLDFNGISLENVDEQIIDNNAIKSKMTIGYAQKDKKGVFIDFSIGGHSAYTELFLFEKGKINRVFDFQDKNPKTFQIYPVGAQDVDQDGIIEIGVVDYPENSKDVAFLYVPWITNWYIWDGQNGLTLKYQEYINKNYGYRFKIPKHWKGNFTISEQNSFETNSLQVIFYGINGSEKVKLFTIKTVNSKEWSIAKQIYKNRDFILIDKNNRYVNMVFLNKDKKAKEFYNESKSSFLKRFSAIMYN